MKFDMTAKTFHGLEEILAAEIRSFGGENIEIGKRAVIFSGDKKLLYRVNYESRLTLNVLVPVFAFDAKSIDDLYSGIQRIDWSKFMDLQTTFSIQSTIHSEIFNHSRFVVLKVKDAIVDQFREKLNERPSINTDDPDIKINIHINDQEVIVSLDASGEPLYKRGYRKRVGEAHINEVLAAGLIQLSGWDKKSPFLDPMCGSGTILCEAAMLATNTPAGLYRRNFGFQKWKDFESEIWNKIKADADKKCITSDAAITGFDIDSKNVDIARLNTAFLKNKIQVSIIKADFIKMKPPYSSGMIIMNPPYGERLHNQTIPELYAEIGTTLKHRYAGFSAWIISSNFEALKNIGLKTSRKIPVFNGPLECRFQRFDLYEGSKKTPKVASVD